VNRRHFVLGSSLLGFSSWAWPLRSLAQFVNLSHSEHFFVMVRMPGGWDTTLSLDPMVHINGMTQEDIYLEYQAAEIFGTASLRLGPSALSMQKHMADCHVIKGIEMRRDGGHPANLDMISSGSGDGQSPYYPVELSATTDVGPLGIIMQSTSILTGNRNPILTDLSALQSAHTPDELIAVLTEEGSDTYNEAVKGVLAAADKLKQIPGIIQELSEQGYDNTQLASLAAAFKTEAAYQCCLDLDVQITSLDSHSDHVGRHKAEQTNAWRQVSELFDYFKAIEYKNGVSLFDHTTFLVVSEFNRTPALNGSRGKDHNPHANAVLLAGRGVNGGKTSGGTFVIPRSQTSHGMSEYISHAIDYTDGSIVKTEDQAHEDVHLIFPEDVTKTLGAVFGNPEGYYGLKNTGRLIPGVISPYYRG
jgi:hypothetical protein